MDGNSATVDRHAVGAVRDLHRQELPKRNDADDNDVEGFGQARHAWGLSGHVARGPHCYFIRY